MIVGLSGTHGTGKSTILQGVKNNGFSVDESQISRTAQKMLGWEKLSYAQESVENMWALQNAIITAMYDRDRKIEKSGKLTMVERTPADVWAYTELWCNKLGINPLTDTKARRYKTLCRDLTRSYTRFLIVPTNDQIPFVEEPNRADLKSRIMVRDIINRFITEGGLPHTYIAGTDATTRIIEVISWMVLDGAILRK